MSRPRSLLFLAFALAALLLTGTASAADLPAQNAEQVAVAAPEASVAVAEGTALTPASSALGEAPVWMGIDPEPMYCSYSCIPCYSDEDCKDYSSPPWFVVTCNERSCS